MWLFAANIRLLHWLRWERCSDELHRRRHRGEHRALLALNRSRAVTMARATRTLRAPSARPGRAPRDIS